MVRQRLDYAKSLVNDYLKLLERNKENKPKTIREYRRLLVHALDALSVAGMGATPAKVREDEIFFLRDEYYAHLDTTVARRQIAIFGTFLKHYGNPVVERMHLGWPQGRRSSVKWLSPECCIRLLDSAEGMERPLIHLELLLLMRRCEVIRLTIRDVKWNMIDVLGKGRGEGKWRTVPWARETLQELQYYQKLREDMISRALERDPTAVIPDKFMLYCQYGWKLGAYQETSVDALIKRAAERAGIDPSEVSNHVLRRSGARMMIYASVSIVDVSFMLGHADTRTTMLYLGLTVDDLAKAQAKRDDYLDVVRMQMTASQEGAAATIKPSLFAR